MTKLSFYSMLAALTSFLYACKCSDITCPALEERYAAWLPYPAGEVIRFTDSSGREILFTVNSRDVAPPKTFDCGPDGLGGCKCPNCPEPTAHNAAISTDTSRKIVNAQGATVLVFRSLATVIRKPAEKPDSVFLSYSIFDHSNRIAIAPSFRTAGGDSVLPAFTIGNRTYTDVVRHDVDTAARPYGNPIYNVYFVWRSYYNKENGIIAFYDLKTRALYFRVP